MGRKDFAIMGIGSRLGKWWPTIGLGIRVGFVGSIFGLVFASPPVDYVPWLATGWVVWGMMSSAITGGAAAMNNNKELLLAFPVPVEAFVLKEIVRELFLLLQNFLVILAVLVIFQSPISTIFLLFLPGVAITSVFLFGLGMILAPLVTKFKDFDPLISSIVGVMFFMLPIVWRPETIESDLAHLILGLNPLYHFLQIIRLPLLNEVPTLSNYLLALLGATVFFALGSLVVRRTRNKIVYWA
jgi:lipopolysaccharide transport system permease protein